MDISIRGVLDYYEGEVTFSQLMALYLEGKTEFKAGMASSQDLRTICEECDIDPIDIRKLQPVTETVVCSASEKEGKTFDEIVASISELERGIYNLSKAMRKLGQKSPARAREIVDDSFGKRIEIAELYEHLYAKFGMDSANLMYAVRYRREAAGIDAYSSPTTTAKKRKAAENLLRLGEIEHTVEKDRDAKDHLEAAVGIFRQVICGIRSTRGKMAAEENARIAVAHLNLHHATGLRSHLDEAERMLQAYEEHDKGGRYTNVLVQITELKEGAE